MSLDFDSRRKLSMEAEARKKYKFRCDQAVTLPKSLSTRVAAVPHSPCQSESDISRPTSSKTRFKSIRKMLLDPFVKSKSQQRSPLSSSVLKAEEAISPANHSMSRHKTLRISLVDQMRLGGGCDCGGWDIECPLIVYSNLNIQYDEDHDHKLVEN